MGVKKKKIQQNVALINLKFQNRLSVVWSLQIYSAVSEMPFHALWISENYGGSLTKHSSICLLHLLLY